MMNMNKASLEKLWYAMTIERQECGVIRGKACLTTDKIQGNGRVAAVVRRIQIPYAALQE